MKKIIAMILAVASFAVCVPTMAATKQYYFYVSSTGSDSNDGKSEANAFATITKARNEVAKSTYKSANVEIRILSGEYDVANEENGKLSFNASYDGSASISRKYVGWGDTKPVIKSSVTVPASGFQTPASNDATLKLIPESSKANIRYIDLASYNIPNNTLPYYGNLTENIEPYADGVVMHPAQYPNKGEYLQVGTPSASAKDEWIQSCTYTDSRISRFIKDDIYAYGSWSNYYYGASIKVSSIDTDTNTINFEKYSSGKFTKGQDYILYNVVEDLDAPGEYYIDQANRRMYFYYTEGTSEIEFALNTEALITMSNAGYITFENLSFETSGGSGMNINGCNNITVKNCDFKNLGVRAANMYNSASTICDTITFENCKVENMGLGGFRIGDDYTQCGLTAELKHCNVTINNCEIHDSSRRAEHNTSGVGINGCGATVTNTKIYNMPHFGITLSGAENMIKNNEIYNVCNKSYDCGGVYNHANWEFTGNEIDYNYFHNITGREGKGTRAVYFDNAASGNFVRGNIFAYCDEGVIVNGGSDTVIKDNIFFSCDSSIYIPQLQSDSNISSYSPHLHIRNLGAFINLGDKVGTNITSISPDDLPAAEEIVFTVDAWNKPQYQYILEKLRGFKNGDITYLYPDDEIVTGNTYYNTPAPNITSANCIPNSTFENNVQKEAVMYK